MALYHLFHDIINGYNLLHGVCSLIKAVLHRINSLSLIGHFVTEFLLYYHCHLGKTGAASHDVYVDETCGAKQDYGTYNNICFFLYVVEMIWITSYCFILTKFNLRFYWVYDET